MVVSAPRCKRNYNLFPDDRADALHPEYDGWTISTGQTCSNSISLILCQFSDKVAPESMYFGKLKARLKVLT